MVAAEADRMARVRKGIEDARLSAPVIPEKASKLSVEGVPRLRLQQIKRELKQRGCSTEGAKVELVLRLQEAVEAGELQAASRKWG